MYLVIRVNAQPTGTVISRRSTLYKVPAWRAALLTKITHPLSTTRSMFTQSPSEGLPCELFTWQPSPKLSVVQDIHTQVTVHYQTHGLMECSARNNPKPQTLSAGFCLPSTQGELHVCPRFIHNQSENTKTVFSQSVCKHLSGSYARFTLRHSNVTQAAIQFTNTYSLRAILECKTDIL